MARSKLEPLDHHGVHEPRLSMQEEQPAPWLVLRRRDRPHVARARVDEQLAKSREDRLGRVARLLLETRRRWANHVARLGALAARRAGSSVGQLNVIDAHTQPVVIEKLDDGAAPEQRTRCAVGAAAHHAPLVGAHLEPRALRACKREVRHELEVDRSPRDLPVELDDEGVVVAAQHLMRQWGWQSDDKWIATHPLSSGTHCHTMTSASSEDVIGDPIKVNQGQSRAISVLRRVGARRQSCATRS